MSAWLVFVTASFALTTGVVGESLFQRLTSGPIAVNEEADEGADILAQAAPTGPSVTVHLKDVELDDAAFTDTLQSASARLLAGADVAEVQTPVPLPEPMPVQTQAHAARTADQPQQQPTTVADPAPGTAPPEFAPQEPPRNPLINQERDAAAVRVLLRAQRDPDRLTAATADVRAQLRSMAQALVHEGVVGEFAIYDESTLIDDVVAQLESDLKTGELVALPLSLVVMVLVFAGVIAAGLPLAGAVASIGAALLMMLGLSHLVDTDATVINVVTVLGLGLSIDYGLLMVSRYREEVRDLRHPAETEVSDEQVTKAVTTTIRTAGRTVLFSGLTIAISLAGLVLFDPPILTAIGLAGLSVVVVAVTAATTLVPSLLVLAGRPVIHQGLPSRVPVVRRLTKRLGDLAPQTGAFTRLAGWTTRHRGMVIVGSLTVLGALALPASDLRLCSATEEMLPASHPTRQAATALYQDFPALRPPSIVALLRGADKDTVAAAHQWQQDSHRIAGVEPSLSPVTSAQGYTWFGVRTSNSADSPQATHAVRQLRESAPPTTQTWATGQPAALVDFVDALTARMWLVLGVVAAATLVLLFLLTGSVLIPVKAVLTNILSLGATLGVLVWAFQWGNLSGLLDFTTPTGLDAVIPTLILAFGFGLAMDYEVFLISRITEYHEQGKPTSEAVADGLQRSGRIITSAALIMVAVFLGFAAGDMLIIKQIGVGLAVAVAIDATLVRVLLVPATMALLNDANWWAPRPLRWVHKRLGLRH
ncbi:MAG: hypothetical protein CSA58_07540 [Micrococcales bacterium]|nr:MAG: hypothetical protein CSA58_07540 [Micrococcales bacterium]